MIELIVITLLTIVVITMLVTSFTIKPKFNHTEPVHYLDDTIIIVDNFTAHRLRFKLGNRNKHIDFMYDSKDDNYILTINHFSEKHKEKILKEINL